jgi:hypothetical protein
MIKLNATIVIFPGFILGFCPTVGSKSRIYSYFATVSVRLFLYRPHMLANSMSEMIFDLGFYSRMDEINLYINYPGRIIGDYLSPTFVRKP